MPEVRILHRDDHLAVVDKPAGVLVVPAPGRRDRTLVDLVTAQLAVRAMAVHRLDEETTGVMVVAFTDVAKVGLEDLFRRHAVEREYLALLTATPSPPAGRIEAQLRENERGVVEVVRSGGVRAITHYETIARRARGALVRCWLETGRRNQIRAHFAALGCPLAGDRKYGYRVREGERHPRTMLHSWRIRFSHPIDGTLVEQTATPAEAELRP